MEFLSTEGLAFPITQSGGSWQTSAYATEEAVVLWILSKDQMGTKPSAAVLA